MNSDDISPHFSAVLNRINQKKTNYCAVCDVSTCDSKSFTSHVAGRKHQLQLKRIENAGFDKWAKKEAKKVRRKVLRTVVSKKSEKSAKKRRKSGFVELSRPTRVLKELTPEEKPGSSEGGNSGSDTKELKRETQIRELHSVDNSELVGTIHSKISTEGCNCLSLEKVPVVQQRDINQVGGSFSVSSPSSCSTKMHPGENFNLPRYYNAKTAFPRFNVSRPPPNLNNFMMDLRRQQYRYYPPHPLNYRGGYQHHRGYPPRNIPPFHFPGAPPYQQKYPPYQQGSNAGNVHLRNSKDVRRGEAWNEVIGELHSSFSGSGEMPRAEMHKGTDSQSYGSKFQTNFNHRSNVSHSRHYESIKSGEVRSPKDVRSEKSLPAEHTKVKQSKTVASTKQYAKANESLPKKPPELKSVDCPKARLRASRSGDPAAASSARIPTLSNVVMQRMNARLQSFTKYGKMPTSGQIRHLALSGTSPVQENADGKLREWSKKINESHHNLSAEDKELINRLVNFPCSRSEQKKLEYCIREHARSRKKLTLPRFNLQLSGVEACKGSPSVDDNVSSMVTEVVDCLPEDVLNSLINALNSDIDENVTVDFPFGIDSHLAAQSEEVNGVCGPSHLDHTLLDEDSCRIVDEVRSNSSYEKKPEYPEQGHHGSVHSTLCHTKENSQHTSSLKDIQVGEHNSTVSDHNCPVVATEQLALGSSLEISESRIPSDKQNLSADPQEEASVEITIKKEPSDPQDGKTSLAAVESSDSGRDVDFVVTSRSENAKKIYYKSIRVHIKNEIPDDHHSVDTTSGASSYPSTLSSSPHKSSVSSPVSTVLKDPSHQTAPVSSEEKKRKLGRSVQNDNHSKKPVELRGPTEIKEERVEDPSDSVVSEVAMEGTKAEESGSRTFALGVSLLPSFVTPRNKHAVEDDNHVKENEDFENAVSGYPGLSWISKPQYEPADTVTSLSLSTGTLCTLTALPQNSHIQGVTPFCATANQEFENHANSASDDVGFKVIKVESTDDFKSKESSHMQLDQPPLPKISSVTSIRNCEDIPGDPPPNMCNTSVQIKQEPFSSTPEETNRCDQNSVSIESKKQVNCSKSTLTQSTDSTSAAPLAKSPALSTESHGIAACFPGVIQKVKYSSQREDLEKIPEVSSSTGAVLLDEVQPAAVPIRKDSKSRSLDLIHELLEITASEEKLVERAREAERTISQLTASLEEWKHKKYEIEQEQMKLRMKRQELLLTAAKDSVPCDKRDLQSVSAATSVSSGEEKLSTPSMRNISSLSNEKSDSESESDSSWSQSLSRTHHTRSSNQKRKERRSPRTSSAHAKQKLRPRFKRELSNEPLSDSSASISDGSSKHRIRTRSSRDDGCSSSAHRISNKRICLGIREAQVVLKPLELNRNREKIVVNDDDVVVLKETPRCSTESREEVELSSSDEEMETVQSGEGSESCQENGITPTEPTSSPEFVVNIGVLNAHSTAIVDLKVYDGYLYSCSLDYTAKRFSIKDPKNDSTSYEGHTRTVTSICLSPSKEEVYTTCNDRYLRCFAPDTGVNIKNYEMNYPISCSCEGGGTLYFGLTSGEVIFFSFRLKREVYRLENSSSCPIGRIATVTQGAQRLLCVAANDGIVSLYDTATGLLLRCLEGRVQPPCCIKICDNSVYITTSDKSIVLHDLLSGKLEKMMNWPASATGLELMDDFILTSSYDGLIRCHKKNQKELSLHSLYYGAGKAMVMSMTSYKEWVFTGNRKGLIEAFKFDPSERFSCEYGRCRQNYGRDCDVMHHIESDHLPSVNNKTKTCPWRTCTHYFTPRTTLEEKQNHVKEHLSGICPQAL